MTDVQMTDENWFERWKGHLLFMGFVIYATVACVSDIVAKEQNWDISLPFILGVVALGLTLLAAFFGRKPFAIALFFLLTGSAFYFEFHPYHTIFHFYKVNGITLYYGKPIPFLFFLVYLFLFRKPILHFIRTTPLWN